MALKMFDASAKLPPAGMLTSFITQHPGTFDSCLEVQSEELTGDMLRRRETVNFSSITKPLLLKEQTHWKRRVLPSAANLYISPTTGQHCLLTTYFREGPDPMVGRAAGPAGTEDTDRRYHLQQAMASKMLPQHLRHRTKEVAASSFLPLLSCIPRSRRKTPPPLLLPEFSVLGW